MLSVLASGTLVRDPQSKTGSSGRTFATALMRVPSEDADALLVSLIAFSDSAQVALLALSKGDTLAVAGRGKLSTWDKNGEAQHGLSVVADQVLTIYQIEKRRKLAAAKVQS